MVEVKRERMECKRRKMEKIENGGKKWREKKKWFSISWDGKGEEIILGCWVFHLATLFSSNWRKNWEGHVIEKKNYKITYLLFHHFTFNNKGIIFLKKRDIIVIYYLSVYFFILSTKCIVKKKKKKFISSHFSIIATFSIIPTKRNPGRGGRDFYKFNGFHHLVFSLAKALFSREYCLMMRAYRWIKILS